MSQRSQERKRFEEAYREIAAQAGWRRLAICLSEEERQDQHRLDREASEFASDFQAEANLGKFHIGAPDWSTNRALVYTIEAARCLCGVDAERAVKLLQMALDEVESQSRK